MSSPSRSSSASWPTAPTSWPLLSRGQCCANRPYLCSGGIIWARKTCLDSISLEVKDIINVHRAVVGLGADKLRLSAVLLMIVGFHRILNLNRSSSSASISSKSSLHAPSAAVAQRKPPTPPTPTMASTSAYMNGDSRKSSSASTSASSTSPFLTEILKLSVPPPPDNLRQPGSHFKHPPMVKRMRITTKKVLQ